MIRTYTELEGIDNFEDRFRYLSLRGDVGASTFGFDRHLNQAFYHSREWRHVRHAVIVRDQGCDLGILGFEIHAQILIHHINPINVQDIQHGDDSLIDPEFLITTTKRTHNAIHYGDERVLRKQPVPRHAGDTRLW